MSDNTENDVTRVELPHGLTCGQGAEVAALLLQIAQVTDRRVICVTRRTPPAGRTNDSAASSPPPSAEKDAAGDALQRLLAELPAEFSQDPASTAMARHEHRVIKQSNVRQVHQSLWDLQQALGHDATRMLSPGEGDISA